MERDCSGRRADWQHTFSTVQWYLFFFFNPALVSPLLLSKQLPVTPPTHTAASTSVQYMNAQEQYTAGIPHFLEEKSISPLIVISIWFETNTHILITKLVPNAKISPNTKPLKLKLNQRFGWTAHFTPGTPGEPHRLCQKSHFCLRSFTATQTCRMFKCKQYNADKCFHFQIINTGRFSRISNSDMTCKCVYILLHSSSLPTTILDQICDSFTSSARIIRTEWVPFSENQTLKARMDRERQGGNN